MAFFAAGHDHFDCLLLRRQQALLTLCCIPGSWRQRPSAYRNKEYVLLPDMGLGGISHGEPVT